MAKKPSSSSTKSTRQKPSKTETKSAAENADLEIANKIAPLPLSPTKERKDRRFADLTPDAKQAKRREERQRRKKALDTTITVLDHETPTTATTTTTTTTIETTKLSDKKPSAEKPSLRIKREKKEALKAREWKVSHPIGGRYSTNNLLFSPDEKYILIAQGPSLKIFSTKTSLLYRTLQHQRPPPTHYPYTPPLGNYSSIANYTLDPSNPSQVYTILFSGDLLLWDYTEGTIEGYWKTDLHEGQYLAWCGLCALPSSSTSSSQETTLWTYQEHSVRDFSRKTAREIRALTIPTLSSSSSSSPSEEPLTITSRLILSIEEARPRHLVIIDSNTFTVDSGDYFYIGNRQRTPSTTTEEIALNNTANAPEWRIRKISAPGKISTIDAIIRHKKSAAAGTIQGDVAVGDNTGQIFVYHDILNPASSTKVVKSKLHWHRTSVGCIKYSKDGTYLISGGRETVLVLWQLSTSARQTLPNLGASIKNIVLSPTGSTYGLILADNSILTISTTELKPTASINGIQSRVLLREEHHKTSKKPKRQETEEDLTSSWRIPVLKHPWNPMQILLAAPASQKGESAYPYLQTFDLAQDRGVARQAITRTLVSMKNVDPEGGEVKEPNVRFLGISGDGQWLASADEWAAPARDFVDPGAPQPGFSDRVGKEVVLRFWRWSGTSSSSTENASASASGKGTWELVSMIENPHGVLDNGSAGDLADLTGSPRGATFASVGDDGTVKIWGKRARTRAGVKVTKSDLVIWNCRRNLELFKPSPNVIQHGRIAYSGDGSVVAVSFTDTDADDGVVTIIDPVEGVVKQEIGSLQTGRIFAVTFVNRYLIIAGAERIVIWNLVAGVAEWGSELAPLVGGKRGLNLRSNGFVPNIHLAGSESQGTFAVSINYPLFCGEESGEKEGKKKKSKGGEDLTKAGNTASMVSVFEVEGFGVVCRKRAVNGVLALEAASNGKGGQGYFWLDGAANVYFLSSGGVVSGGTAAGGGGGGYLEDIDGGVGGLANAFLEKAVIEDGAGGEEEALAGNDDDGEGKVVRSHMLAKLFPAPAYASPAVGDIFGRFMEIVGEKALDIPKSSSSSSSFSDNNNQMVGFERREDKEVRLIEDDDDREEGDGDEASEDEFEDAHDGDISMQDAGKDVYADLPPRDFDVIIDEA